MRTSKPTGKILTPGDFIDQPISTEDYATIILHYENGVHGVLTVSQVSSGRKNRLFYEINGSKSSLSWDSERPNEMWIGHRTEPNQVLMKDPSLLSRGAHGCILPRRTQRRLPRYIQATLHQDL